KRQEPPGDVVRGQEQSFSHHLSSADPGKAAQEKPTSFPFPLSFLAYPRDPSLSISSQAAALQIFRKESALRLAPPTSSPTMSAWEKRSAEFSGLTLPP